VRSGLLEKIFEGILKDLQKVECRFVFRPFFVSIRYFSKNPVEEWP